MLIWVSFLNVKNYLNIKLFKKNIYGKEFFFFFLFEKLQIIKLELFKRLVWLKRLLVNIKHWDVFRKESLNLLFIKFKIWKEDNFSKWLLIKFEKIKKELINDIFLLSNKEFEVILLILQ